MIVELIDLNRKMRGAAPQAKVHAYSMPVPNSGCWIWLRAVSPTGYGQIHNGKFNEGAHRFSWRAFNGQIPDDMDICHKCDVRCCVNPDHLYVGDHQQNMDDMMIRGRHRALPGELNGFAKLSDAQIAMVREIYVPGTITQQAVAELVGCSQQLVSRISREEHRPSIKSQEEKA